jgi:ABC-type transport system involved in multi-copper enzyme maturation permease subunit
MTTLASTVPRQRTTQARPARMLFDVAAWELRRFYASRATRWTVLLALGLFLLFGWVLAILRFAGTFGFGDGATFDVAVTSAWGMSMLLPTLTFLLALVLPFVSADGTAHDLKQRTHELLLSSPLPTWAYVLGRYLACLLLTLGLAALLLVMLLLDGVALHLAQRDYPLPDPPALLAIWAVGLAPVAVFICSASFALGTVLRRYSSLAPAAIIALWLVAAVILPVIPAAGSGRVPDWYLHWEPTGNGMVAAIQAPYSDAASAIMASASSGQPSTQSDNVVLAGLARLEQKLPDLAPWILPHLVWAGFGLVLVLAVALYFDRRRTALG